LKIIQKKATIDIKRNRELIDEVAKISMPEIILNDLFSIHERTLNFDKWQPKEEDRPRIVDELHDCYIGTLSNCG
jgi:hypothetical protein